MHCLLTAGVPGLATAALIDRGGGLIYDTDLQITWLQTPSNIPRWTMDNGSTLSAAHYADSFSYYDSIRHKTWSDWRLPTTTSHPFGDPSAGELGHLFTIELGNSGALSNKGLFPNLAASTYWTGTLDPDTAGSGMPHYYVFNFANGSWDEDCGMFTMSDGHYVLLVRDGDVGPAEYQLSLRFAGDGGGSVLIGTSSLACNTDCDVAIGAGTAVTLTPSHSDQYSIFDGWSGACSNSSGNCTLTMDGAKTVTASFSKAPVYLDNPSGVYSTISSAYTQAAAGAAIKTLGITFEEELDFYEDKQISLTGGYDSAFSSSTGETTLKGTLTVSRGSVVLENMMLY